MRLGIYISIFIGLLLSSCSSPKSSVHLPSDTLVRDLLKNARYSDAQKLYNEESNVGSLTVDFKFEHDGFFKMLNLYDIAHDRTMKAEYRYARCLETDVPNVEYTEWRSIAARGNPFRLSPSQVKAAKEKLNALGMWHGNMSDEADSDFQKAIAYFRLQRGMSVECALYPYNLVLQSTFCSLFEDDMKCQPSYEF